MAARWVWTLPILLLTACGPDPTAGKTVIRYMAWGNPEQIALEEGFCQEFNRRNPDLYVKFVKVPGSAYLNKAVVMFASRTAADVVRIDHFNFPDLVRKHFFYDLTAIAAADSGFHYADFFPLAIEEAQYKGGFYGLNQQFGAEIVYYNRTMLRQAGLEDPYALYKRGVWTWDRFRQYAIAMTRRDGSGRATQVGCAAPIFPMDVPVLWAFGGRLPDPDGKRSYFAEPGMAHGYQFLADLIWRFHCAPTPAEDANSAYSFESGKLGMRLDWMGMTPRYRAAIHSFDWDICPIPSGPVDNHSMAKGNQLVVNAESAHPQAAWRFERFLTSPEVETELYAKRRRNFPTRKSVAESKAFLATTQPPFHTQAFLDAVNRSRSLPIGPRWAEWTRELRSCEDNLYSGRHGDAATVMRDAAARVDKILSDEEGF